VLDVRNKRNLWNTGNQLPRGWSLAHLTRLRVLNAARTNIHDAAIAALPPSLHELDLKECDKLPLVASFAHLTCLRTLNLCDTPIDGDATLATLLPSLDLSGVTVTPATVFPHLPALRVLNVSDTDIGDATIASMPAGLEE